MRRLIVTSRPLHGLGNRVRLVLSGQALATATGRRFDYYWPVGRGFGARLTDLWSFQDAIPAVAEGALRLVAPFRDPQTLLEDGPAADARIWHVRSGSVLPLPEGAPDWHEAFAALHLDPGLASAVRELHATTFGDRPYIGVMVRTHPNAHDLTRQHSPLSWYVDRMRELRSELGDVGFYLSCDTASADAELRRIFPTAAAQTKSGSYNSALAIRESVIDLYLLASAAHILGPHHSSFPELAHFLTLGQVPLETSVGESHAQVRPAVSLSIAPDPTEPRRRVKVGR